MLMTVVGLGYLGATHAVALTMMGHNVIGVDPDKSKVENLSKGVLPFYEPGLDEELANSVEAQTIEFYTSHPETSSNADIHWICVGTPQSKEGNSADLSYLVDATNKILEIAKEGSTIVGKSTVPVGTHKILLGLIKKSGKDVKLVWNPEFLREGTALEDSLRPDRVVLGVSKSEDTTIAKEAYKSILDSGVPYIECDLPTAELVKVAANSFLATKISFINAVSEIAEASGADVTKIAEAIGHDDRIGKKFLEAGVGFGGGCLPKDIRAFIARADELGKGESVEFLKEVDNINLRQRDKVVNRAVENAKPGGKVFALGAAFKPNSDDLRDSPALDVALRLADLGYEVVVHDPKAGKHIARLYPQLITTENVEEGFKDAEVVLHLTEWEEYRHIQVGHLPEPKNKVIVDGRNKLNPTVWQSAGWKVIALGRSL
jgi:UDPglucose 6-dehydrogenase